MSKTRFTPWVVLACIGTLAGCTSGEDGTAGNTELNIVLPNGCERDTSSPECFDIQVVEYTIACDDGDPAANGPFLDNNAGFDDRVVINGFLEVFDTPQDGRPGRAASNDPWTWGNTLGDIYVAQGFMDLPVTQDCKAQLRARTAPTSDNPDGEVICSDTVTFGVEADKVSTVNVLMRCGLSFQAPVAQLDLAGDFSFNVSNFCPDLMVLNCLDSNPTEPEGAASTTCQVRFRDGDNQCGNSCDPQVCTEAPEGLRCAPACEADSSCPTEPTTVVSCGGAAMDCDGLGGADDTSCTFTGNTTGTPILTGIDEGSFDVNCGLSASGATVTCTAVTTDGDTDCDKTKTVSFDCPGLNFCDQTTPNDNLTDCEAINGTPEETCLIWTCDRDDQACVSTPVPAGGGNNCDFSGTAAGECDGNDPPSCLPFGCQSPEDCDPDSNDCLVPPSDSCVAGVCCDDPTNGCQAGDLIPGNAGGTCDSGVGSRDGTCDTPATGACDPNDECDSGNVSGCPGPSPATICQEAVCDVSGAPWVCDIGNANEGEDCNVDDPSIAGTDGTCQSGTCVTKVFANVCEQFSSEPLLSADGQGVCEKIEFIAIDCELLGNSAPLPLNASVQPVDIDGPGPLTDIAFAGVTIGVYIQDAFVLPASLVCGFIGAGFTSSGVADSTIDNSISNANITSELVYSFLDDGSDSPNLVSLHDPVTYSFPVACGDDCVDDTNSSTGKSCLSNSAVECESLTFTDNCSIENGGAVGTGPGIFAPFLANSPGSILVDTTTGELTPTVGPVVLTPTAAGSVDFQLNYATTEILLPDLTGSIVTQACVGGACDTSVCDPESFSGICDIDATCSILTNGFGTDPDRCSDDLSPCDIANGDADCAGTDLCVGTGGSCTQDSDCAPTVGPRIMYEATCSKAGFGACGGTACATSLDCPLVTAGQTCDTGTNLCNNVNAGSCGGGAADLCFVLGTQTAAPCTTDDDCDAVIEAASGGAVPTCCAPFGIYPDVADACKGATPDDKPTECCITGFQGNSDQNPPDGNAFNTDCSGTTPAAIANRRRCCYYYQESYPDSTTAQEPQLWVNPAP